MIAPFLIYIECSLYLPQILGNSDLITMVIPAFKLEPLKSMTRSTLHPEASHLDIAQLQKDYMRLKNKLTHFQTGSQPCNHISIPILYIT